MKALVFERARVLGFAMIGADAGEVVAAVQVAMLAGMRDAILTHPTTPEGLGPLFSKVPSVCGG